MRIAIIGTRGVPAQYGGFETMAEEVGSRLVERGHDVVVYCRNPNQTLREYRGMKLVNLPALPLRAAETLSHTGLSCLHLLFHRVDVAIMCNVANAVMLPILRLRRIPAAVNVDGLEWKRSKWGSFGKRWYRLSERLGVRLAHEIIADSRGIGDYYFETFGTASTFIAYGAPILHDVDAQPVRDFGFEPGCYHLVVTRLEPENHVAEIIEGYGLSGSRLPLVVVGDAKYGAAYRHRLVELAAGDPRVRLVGSVYDLQLLDALYAHARSYAHGHSVGGTNPALLRAMGAAVPVIAFDVVFNREVLGDAGRFFSSPEQYAAAIDAIDADPVAAATRGAALQARAASEYDWDAVTDGYEALSARLAKVESRT